MSRQYTAESKKLVRMYSKEVGRRLPPGSSAQALGKLLQAEADIYDDPQNPWQKFFQGGEVVTKEK